MKKKNLAFLQYENKLLYDNKKKIVSNRELDKILNKYKIPDFLSNVQIVNQTLKSADNSLVFIGEDKTGKLQYFYGDDYVKKRRYNKLLTFLKIDERKKDINKFLNKNKVNFGNKNPLLTKDSILSLLILLEFKFFIRTGRQKYLKENNTTGLLTLKKKNLKVTKDDISIIFTGKKNINHSFLINKFLDDYIFKFLNVLYNNTLSEDDYIFSLDGKFIGESKFYSTLKNLGISLKEIRTYGSNLILIRELWKSIDTEDDINIKKIIKLSLDKAADTIGHSKSISKKSYIIDLLMEEKYIHDIINHYDQNFPKFYNYIINKLKNDIKR